MNTISFIQESSAAAGTVNITDSIGPILFIHEAPGLILNLTINLPPNPQHGQVVFLISINGITTLSLGTVIGGILNTVATLLGAGPRAFMWHNGKQKWIRIY